VGQIYAADSINHVNLFVTLRAIGVVLVFAGLFNVDVVDVGERYQPRQDVSELLRLILPAISKSGAKTML